MTEPARDAGFRLRRLLAVLAVLARDGHAPLAELARRFDMTPGALAADLQMAACCGLPPYTPDQLMEIVVDDTEVVAHLEPALARPRRLTPAEGLALVAAARAILAVPGADPGGALSRAVAKLEAAIGGRGGLQVVLDEPQHLEAVRRATDGRRQISLRYHSASRDEVTERVVDPLHLLVLDGSWYLDGFCHRARSIRRFRVDRILQMAETGSVVPRQPDANVAPAVDGEAAAGGADQDRERAAGVERWSGGSPYVPSPDATVVSLVVDDEGARILDAVPTLVTERRPDGRLAVDLAVSSVSWLGRLLVRLGPHAEVLAPADLVDSGVPVARRILARYQVG